MIDDVKLRAGISVSTYDDMIAELLAAAKQDLITAGVDATAVMSDSVPMIRVACITFALSQIPWTDAAERATYTAAYDRMVHKLQLAGEICEVTL
jgi:hypothetical protein